MIECVAVCGRKNQISDVSKVLPLCGIVWPRPGSQGIKSSLQSPNLDFLLFMMCNFSNYKITGYVFGLEKYYFYEN